MRHGVIVMLLIWGVPCFAQYRMYVTTESWEVIVVDIDNLQEIESFEIVRQPPPLLEDRGKSSPALYVPGKNLLFVGNSQGGSPPPGTSFQLKIMKVDMLTKVSTMLFSDQPGEESLMPDEGRFYFDVTGDRLYAYYETREVVYSLQSGQVIQTFNNVSTFWPHQNSPRFENLIYTIGNGKMIETDITTMSSQAVLDDLEGVGGDPYASGVVRFNSQDATKAEALIADRKTTLYKLTKNPSGLWTITSQKQYFYVVDGQSLSDIPGYKRFDGDLLSIMPGGGDLRFWVFDPNQTSQMPLVYLVNLPTPSAVWSDADPPPRLMVDPASYLISGTNRVATIYAGDTFDRFRILILDATTGQVLNVFDFWGGVAGVAFSGQ